MATNATWTVVFEDKKVIKQSGDGAGSAYKISDNDFWGLSKWSNIWAIQYGTSNPSDEVEYRDGTPHSTFASANLNLCYQSIIYPYNLEKEYCSMKLMSLLRQEIVMGS